MSSEAGNQTDLNGLWDRFRFERGSELDAWIAAERSIALARRGAPGHDGGEGAGDRLLATEAALQGAIVDFAASQADVEDFAGVALELLKMAERSLDPGEGERAG